MEDAVPKFPMKRFLQESFWCFVICAIIAWVWQAWPRPVPEGIAFSLQSPIVGWLFNAILLFIGIDVPYAFYRFAGETLEVRPIIRKAYSIAFALPILFLGIYFEFGRFDTVIVDDERVALRGPSFLAELDFRINDIELVYLKGDSVLTELVFMWYDKVLQSTWIFSFDATSSKELEKLIAELGERGVKVHEQKPEGMGRLGRFRPLE